MHEQSNQIVHINKAINIQLSYQFWWTHAYSCIYLLQKIKYNIYKFDIFQPYMNMDICLLILSCFDRPNLDVIKKLILT